MNFLEINILSFFLLLIIFILIMVLDQNNKVKFKEIRLICLSGFLVSLSLVLKIYINPIISAIIPYSKIFHFGYSDFVLVLSSFFAEVN